MAHLTLSFVAEDVAAECVFDSKAAEKTGYRGVRIAFAIDDDIWREVANTAMIVFGGCPWFILVE